jgi:anti-anti-sigma regulatory factor
MRHVEAIDATGLRELVNCSVLATHKNVELKIVEPSKNAQAIIELTRIDYLLPFIQQAEKQEQESESPIVMTLMTALFCVYVVLMIYAFFNGFD